jgi:hypothetical protein
MSTIMVGDNSNAASRPVPSLNELRLGFLVVSGIGRFATGADVVTSASFFLPASGGQRQAGAGT